MGLILLRWYSNTIYVLNGFIPIPLMGTVFAGTGMVMESCTHGIPMVNPSHHKCSSCHDPPSHWRGSRLALQAAVGAVEAAPELSPHNLWCLSGLVAAVCLAGMLGPQLVRSA